MPLVSRRSSALVRSVLAASALLLVATGCDRDTPAPTPDTDLDASVFAFADAVGEAPEGWTGPVFELSHDYPTADPGPCAPADCPWLGLTAATDFESQSDSSMAPGAWENSIWPEWMETVKTVIRQGQDDQLSNEAGFRSTVNGQTAWYHVPWMAYDPTVGREFIHGTTNERTAHLSDLLGASARIAVHELPPSVATRDGSPGQDPIGADDCPEANAAGFETWAVGMYNTYGGYALGQAFPASGEAQVVQVDGRPAPAGLPFPTGTLVTKFLFTTAPTSCVPYLEGAPEWTVDRHTLDDSDSTFACRRTPQTVRLVQVDVAAVDPKSPTRWIYGTFAYNGKLDGDTIWDRLQPVGIQWGSDPDTFPAVEEADSVPARQGVLNVAMTEDSTAIYEHFGCRGRLAGPVDNKLSSCMSCHASAYAAASGISEMGTNVPPSFGYSGICEEYSAENADYFFNNLFPDAYHGGQYPDALNLDTSMQLSVAFTQYQTFTVNQEPKGCTLDGGANPTVASAWRP